MEAELIGALEVRELDLVVGGLTADVAALLCSPGPSLGSQVTIYGWRTRAVLTQRARAEACRRIGKDAHAVAAVARDLGGWVGDHHTGGARARVVWQSTVPSLSGLLPAMRGASKSRCPSFTGLLRQAGGGAFHLHPVSGASWYSVFHATRWHRLRPGRIGQKPR